MRMGWNIPKPTAWFHPAKPIPIHGKCERKLALDRKTAVPSRGSITLIITNQKDVNAGLIGAIVITRKGMARPDGSPKDIAHEFFSLFMIIDENQSRYFDHNVKANIADPAKIERGEYTPLDPEGIGDLPLGTGFGISNMKNAINGYLFSNGPLMTMRKGEHVRWYVMTMGIGFNFHTPHWHGNLVSVRGQYMDVLPTIGPAQIVTADMVPDKVGTWMFHCHVDDHMKGGMQTLYRVLDKDEPLQTTASIPSASIHHASRH
jgi:FtsP/CotA-like multicopper oxidase with cupredoxin domain